jgi:hypothetical protein
MHHPKSRRAELRLYIGKAFTGVTVVPDDRWPDMWRVCKDGVKSDMVNLARAKDASITWALPRRPGGGEIVHWEVSRERPARRPGELKPSPPTQLA